MVLGWCGLRRYLRGGLRAVFGRLEAILGRLGASWGDLGTSWDGLEESWDVLGRSWVVSDPSCSHLGAVLGRLAAILGPSWSQLGASMGRLGIVLGRLGVFFGSFLWLSSELRKSSRKKHKFLFVFLRFGVVWEGILWRSWGVLDGLDASLSPLWRLMKSSRERWAQLVACLEGQVQGGQRLRQYGSGVVIGYSLRLYKVNKTSLP